MRSRGRGWTEKVAMRIINALFGVHKCSALSSKRGRLLQQCLGGLATLAKPAQRYDEIGTASSRAIAENEGDGRGGGGEFSPTEHQQ